MAKSKEAAPKVPRAQGTREKVQQVVPGVINENAEGNEAQNKPKRMIELLRMNQKMELHYEYNESRDALLVRLINIEDDDKLEVSLELSLANGERLVMDGLQLVKQGAWVIPGKILNSVCGFGLRLK